MQIMKGYHCSSDSINLRVLRYVCVPLSGCVHALCRMCCSGTQYSAADSHPIGKAIQPT